MGRRPRPAAFPELVVPKTLTAPHSTPHIAKTRPMGPDRHGGSVIFNCAFPDRDRSACLNDRPAPSRAWRSVPLDLAMRLPFLLQSCYCVPSCRAGWKRTASWPWRVLALHWGH